MITHKNILSLINNEEVDFLLSMDPMIVVKELTIENIERAIKEYAKDDNFWLKFYHLTPSIDIKTLDILRDHSLVREKLLDELNEKDESIDTKNYNFIDFNE